MEVRVQRGDDSIDKCLELFRKQNCVVEKQWEAAKNLNHFYTQ
ncbi:hypothetical protein [Anaeromicropila populeti]|nr:hypothetical protein [Anaeromicropila populeti]